MLPLLRRLRDLADPFAAYEATTPPDRYWPFMWSMLAPLKRPMLAAAGLGMCVAVIETSLIWYAGRLVDMLAQVAAVEGAEALWSLRGLELALVALLILTVRPLAIGAQMATLDMLVGVNAVALVRWRAHRHVLGQSASFFQNDFAGRIANRIVQTAPAVEESAFGALEGIVYFCSYVIGALLVLSQADPRLAIPILIWLAVYGTILRVLVPRMAHAAEESSKGRSALTGAIVDAYTNIQTVKLFAHGKRELDLAREAIEDLRDRDGREMGLMSVMSFSLALTGGMLIVGALGTAVWLWSIGETRLDHVGDLPTVPLCRHHRRGDDHHLQAP